MPSKSLLQEYDDHLTVEQQWNVSGINYSRTCEAWLKNLDASYDELLTRFSKEMDSTMAQVRLQRGECFSWPAQSCFAIAVGTNGSSHTI